MSNRYYFYTTNAGNGVAVTAADDQQVAVLFHDGAENNLSTRDKAINADYSNVDGMTAEQMQAEYGDATTVNVVTGFTTDLSDFESCEDITDYVRMSETFCVIGTGTIKGVMSGTDEMFARGRFYQILHAENGRTYRAFYDDDDQPDALDEYGNLILDQIDYSRISELEEEDDD